MYKSVKSWGVNAFKSQKDVLQADDKELGFISYKFSFTELFESSTGFGTKFSINRKYWAVLKIFMKDNKAKITVENLELESEDGKRWSILTLQRDEEASLPKNWSGRMVKKQIENQRTETRNNFLKANNTILETIEKLFNVLISRKSEFEF